MMFGLKVECECVCGTTFSTEHALSCPTSGVTICRHNEVRDLVADLLTDVCHDVNVQPHLQPLSGETFTTCSTATEDNSCLDIAASGFREGFKLASSICGGWDTKSGNLTK